MTDENGGTVRWRLAALEEGLKLKADAKDVNAVGDQVRGLRSEMREQFGQVNKRIDNMQDQREQDRHEAQAQREEDRQAAALRQRTLLITILGCATSVAAAFIGSGQL